MKVLDSDIVIAALRGTSDAIHAAKLLEEKDELAATSPTEYEVLLGAYFYGRKAQIEKTEEFFGRYSVLPLDHRASRRAALIRAKLMRKGADVDDMDVLIAAIALENEASIVTRNKEHFKRIEGLDVEGW